MKLISWTNESQQFVFIPTVIYYRFENRRAIYLMWLTFEIEIEWLTLSL
jgi:hypothetical protein